LEGKKSHLKVSKQEGLTGGRVRSGEKENFDE